jgi:RNA-directed DNA polymerase
METAAGVRYFTRSRGGIETAPDAPVLVRYADDLLALCHDRRHAEQVKQKLAGWLAPRGLKFNEDKTRIVHVNQGCDFLGFNIRRYHGKLPLIKPSNTAVRRIRHRLRTEIRALLGGNAPSVMRTLWGAPRIPDSGSNRIRVWDGGIWCPNVVGSLRLSIARKR